MIIKQNECKKPDSVKLPGFCLLGYKNSKPVFDFEENQFTYYNNNGYDNNHIVSVIPGKFGHNLEIHTVPARNKRKRHKNLGDYR